MAQDLDLGWDETFGEDDEQHQDLTAADALITCLRERGHVDLSHIAHLCGLDERSARDALGTSVFFDPDLDEWQTAAQYLSGNLYDRLEVARKAAESDHTLDINVSALEQVLPPWVPASEIFVTLGSPWVPADIIEQFVYELLGLSRRYKLMVLHDPVTGTWTVRGSCKARLARTVISSVTWGTTNMPALDILEASLNGRDIRVYQKKWEGYVMRRTLDVSETMTAVEKQGRLIEEFRRWLWSDEERTRRLERAYYERYCAYACPRFDGSCLGFPGLAEGVELRDYQRDAVMRILLTKQVLLAHDVGAGKTYTCIAAGMELKRLDATEKLLYVVPNNVQGQWKDLFRTLYPASNVFVVSPRSFTRARRQEVLARIRDEEFDAIIMAASSFDLIPISRKERLREVDEELKRVRGTLGEDEHVTTGALRERTRLEDQRRKLCAGGPDEEKDVGICLDDLGITRLFVDEAHNYKNLPTRSSGTVFGVTSKGSKKCEHLLQAVRHIMRSGGGVVFATGTVLTNTLCDLFAFQRYLQPHALASLELTSFDAWCQTFARRRTEWEIDVDTARHRLTTRLSGFGNLTGLSQILGTVADFHHVPAAQLPVCGSRIDVIVARTPELASYLERISERADRVRTRSVPSSTDNLLKICTDGRKAALDIRLVDDRCSPAGDTKVAACAAKVFDIWTRTARDRLTQVVFCDISTPQDGFNVYDELRHTLVRMGIPAHEVRFVHDARTERERSRLFRDMREGVVRVLVGSTPKLGIGVNIQDRLAAAHHLDVPWRPADMTQREGRILREGNRCREVKIFRYVTQGSFDAYSWQLLEHKQHLIDELLSGTYAGRFLESDIGDVALTFGEVKALAVGNPLLRERIEVANELERARILQRQRGQAQARLVLRVDELERMLKATEARLVACRKDAAFVHESVKVECTPDQRRQIGRSVLSAVGRSIRGGRESQALDYRGFGVVAPVQNDPTRPRVELIREGRWPVQVVEGRELGVVTRLDNVLDGLDRRADTLEESIRALTQDRAQALVELGDAQAAKDDGIGQLEARLALLDLAIDLDGRKDATAGNDCDTRGEGDVF